MSVLGPAIRWATRSLPILIGVVLVACGVALQPHVAFLFVAAFLFAWWLVPRTAVLARHLGAIAKPGGRGIHRRTTPLLGGVAIFLPVAGGLIVLAVGGDTKALGMLAGATLVFWLGVVDDIRGVGPASKIAVQLAAGVCLVLAGFRLPVVTASQIFAFDTGVLEIALILFWVVLATNAFNLIDGMDGIAASVGFLASIGLVAIGVMPAVGLLLAGTTLGFLRYNWPPARIFLGDCGSQTIGFLLAAMVLELPPERNVPLAVALLAYPLGDVFLAVLRRFLRAKPIFAADRSHVHHKALEYLGNSRNVLLAVILFSASLMAIGLLRPGRLSLAVSFLAWATVAALLLRASNLRGRPLLAHRRPLRYLYSVRQYVRDGFRHARTGNDVALVLRHLAEALRLDGLQVREVEVGVRRASDRSEKHVVHLKKGTGAWFAARASLHGVLEEERDSILTELLREADSRLRALARAEEQAAYRAARAQMAGLRRRPRAEAPVAAALEPEGRVPRG